jgi:glycosyltransferase involved in cell wall biosynthesis
VAIRVVFSLLITIIAPLLALWLGKEGDTVLGILIASSGLILYAFQGPLNSALTACERLDYTSVFTLVSQVVVPSIWYENSPNVILEAFAHRTPVVASDLGGMAELVEDGVNGLRFTPGDASSLGVST